MLSNTEREIHMKNKKKIAMVVMTIAAILLIAIVLSVPKANEIEKIIPIANKEPITQNRNSFITKESIQTPVSDIIQNLTPTSISNTIPLLEEQPPYNSYADGSFASITISTDRKTRICEIMPDVEKDTLKYNIGWLPGSALPGENGCCVLMGHRDSDFSILQYVEAGNELVLSMNGNQYIYRVTNIEIVESDSELRFNSLGGCNLVLVTCYPFRYSGNAPRKYVVFGKINNIYCHK